MQPRNIETERRERRLMEIGNQMRFEINQLKNMNFSTSISYSTSIVQDPLLPHRCIVRAIPVTKMISMTEVHRTLKIIQKA